MFRRQIHTHIEAGLGDTLLHLHFLRKLAAAYPELDFVHAYGIDYRVQYEEFLKGCGNIKLVRLDEAGPDSIDCWRNAPTTRGTLSSNDSWVEFYIKLFERIAAFMGLENPIKEPSDMLFDEAAIPAADTSALSSSFDFLVINTPPNAIQFDPAKKDRFYLDPLIDALKRAGRSIVCTSATKIPGVPVTIDHGISVCGIGKLSLTAKNIVMISCGASWLTFNVWNRNTPRIVLILHDIFELPGNMVTVGSIQETFKLLKKSGY